ncbi:DUF1097 domain-containing protein [Chamaesiphon minutus]|uniref:Uncharacterized protein n=1 Tax=Chamaesiphon minutus (strain ATCC 27169 / PCC 6605) TaxID=1173020 RepID=K9UD92_CHAP6|nr:DUF1097 domain-containing protein [Chamaesiphon minutus]AFY92386.1 hypothetical protein Cha6605_1166 [Chamaesiphon minutus PCC 6605]
MQVKRWRYFIRKTRQLNRNNFLKFLVQSEPGKPAIANGLRAALSLGIPMLIGQSIDQRESGLFVGLIAYFVNLANVAGSYQIKAKAMAIATLGIIILVFVGTLVASIPILAVVLTFLWGLASGFASLYGNTGANVGLVLEQLADAVEQEIIPPPLPDLDAMLRRIRSHLQALRTARMSELEIDSPGERLCQRGNTLTRQAVIDYSILDLEIDQLVRRLSAMHSAIVRLKLVDSIQN